MSTPGKHQIAGMGQARVVFFLFVILFSWLSFFPESIRAFQGLFILCFLSLFFVVLLLDKKYSCSIFDLQDWFLWLFLICLAAGTISSQSKFIVFRTYGYLAIVLFFFFYIGKVLFCFSEDRERLVLVICLCAGSVALIGLLELYFGKNVLYENFFANSFYFRFIGIHPRPMSTQFNPAVLGSYLLACMPFSFAIMGSRSLASRLIGFFSFLLCTLVIILTFSRGVFLGFVALLLFYLWNSGKKRYGIVFFAGLIFFIAFASYQKDVNMNRYGFNRFVAGSPDSIVSRYRFDRVAMAVEMIKDYPFFGIGFHQSSDQFNDYYDWKNKGREPLEFMVLDNMYLTILAETGVIGMSGFLIFVFVLFKRGFRRIKESSGEERKLLLISLAAIVGLLVNMGAYELFYWKGPYMLFCLFCGFVCSEKKDRKSHDC